jgi:hypothetical protein
VAIEKKCVVCGAGSHRLDWQGLDFPSCEAHTPAEYKEAMAALHLAQANKQGPPPTPAQPPLATPPAAVPKVV